ncbi:MAG: pitrilysin family protein [Acidobacteriota bacterium]
MIPRTPAALRGPVLGLVACGLAFGLVACGGAPEEPAAEAPTDLAIPIQYSTLDNGLKVVLSPDETAPVVTVAVYYHIGFRNEPKGRTGFAHLFEHLMFQGSENLGKMGLIRLVQGNGGTINGSTRLDFTNYVASVPSHKLETLLWAEADRMRSLKITDEELINQQGVVANEVKVNVVNQPYGGFPWLDLPQVAFSNWYNAHNFYGDLDDIQAATLEDAQAFFDAYYAPNNAVLVVVGDFDPAQAKAWVQQYFTDIPEVELAPKPDVSEPPQEAERRGSRVDPQAPRPALAFGYPMPDVNSDDYVAMAVLDEILIQGDDSLLHRKLVQEMGVTASVSGGINFPLGTAWNVEGPALWSGALRHDAEHAPDEILAALQSVIEQVKTEGVDAETFDRAMVQLRSGFYDYIGNGWGRADLLASFALFHDDPERINRLEAQLRAVRPEHVKRVAAERLKPSLRSVFVLETGPAAGQENPS